MIRHLHKTHLEEKCAVDITAWTKRIEQVIEKLEWSLKYIQANRQKAMKALQSAVELEHTLKNVEIEVQSFRFYQVIKDIIANFLAITDMDDAYRDLIELKDEIAKQIERKRYMKMVPEEELVALESLYMDLNSYGKRLKKVWSSEDVNGIVYIVDDVLEFLKEMIAEDIVHVDIVQKKPS
ncbi:hypothetical protein [Laceyella putida]|uniref:DUF47 family protein n=1 Tax=Laceyella putida TaxID=110101 RepID=A0ABW2RJ71_9BACL